MKLINSKNTYLHGLVYHLKRMRISDAFLEKYHLLSQVWEYIALISILAIGFTIRYPLVRYNLPLAANVDERLSLSILYRFDSVNLNPEWFHYPSFFYYLTFFWVDLFGDINSALFYGRILNLLFGCGLAVSVFFLSQYLYKSKTISLIAAALTMFSPLLIESGSYIITDILLAMLSVIALLFLSKFRETQNYKFWLISCLAIGLALSTKYTALILVLTYGVFELTSGKLSQETTQLKWPINLVNKRLDSTKLTWIFLIGFLGLFAISILFPYDLLMSILKTSGDINSTVDAQDIIFLNSLKQKVLYLSILALICTIVSYRFPRIFEGFSYLRLYVGIGAIILVFLLGSPYTLISWKTFIYDFGSELKHNDLDSKSSQWFAYIRYYFDRESLVVLLFLLIGIFVSVKKKIRLGVILIYLLIYYLIIGSATRSFPRYLAAFLPILFPIAASGMNWVGNCANRYRKGFRSIIMIFSILVIAAEVYAKFPSALHQNSPQTDELFESYHFVKQYNPSQVYFLGISPNVELRMGGIKVEKILESSSILNKSDLGNNQPNQIVILDRDNQTKMSPEVRQRLKLLWSTNRGDGQYIYEIK